MVIGKRKRVPFLKQSVQCDILQFFVLYLLFAEDLDTRRQRAQDHWTRHRPFPIRAPLQLNPHL